MSLTEAAASGNRLETLRSLRDFLARQLDECESLRDAASLSNQLRATLAEIAVLEPKKSEGDQVDEIAARRAARRSTSSTGSARAKRSAK